MKWNNVVLLFPVKYMLMYSKPLGGEKSFLAHYILIAHITISIRFACSFVCIYEVYTSQRQPWQLKPFLVSMCGHSSAAWIWRAFLTSPGGGWKHNCKKKKKKNRRGWLVQFIVSRGGADKKAKNKKGTKQVIL